MTDSRLDAVEQELTKLADQYSALQMNLATFETTVHDNSRFVASTQDRTDERISKHEQVITDQIEAARLTALEHQTLMHNLVKACREEFQSNQKRLQSLEAAGSVGGGGGYGGGRMGKKGPTRLERRGKAKRALGRRRSHGEGLVRSHPRLQ